MLPSEYWKGPPRIDDVRNRILNTIIELDGMPIYINNLNVATPGGYPYISSYYNIPNFEKGNGGNIPLNHPGLNIVGMGRKLGWFNIGPNQVGYLQRVPRRSMVQGLCNKTLLHTVYYRGTPITVSQPKGGSNGRINDYLDMDQKTQDRVAHIYRNVTGQYELSIFFSSPGIVDMYNNKYPNVLEILDQTKPYQVAVSRRYVLDRDDFGDVYLAWKGLRIGKLSKERVRYLNDKAYIAGDVERTLGLKPV